MNVQLLMLVTIFSLQCLFGDSIQSVSFTTIDKGYFSGIDDRVEKIFRTNDEFDQFWLEHKSIIYPVPLEPNIDFEGDNALVAAIFSGLKLTGGYEIYVTSVEMNDNEDIIVRYETSDPTPDDMVNEVLTQPFHVVEIKLPQSISQEHAIVQFEEAKVETNYIRQK
eukprot:CAMPEP_0194362314 /NCGR_PEP_ID=MMETSP0174-20130528/10053_1 /TAXON_ID=216777 /ORGANISM="Proboscia alata, Strain PI-D3" /LENGTH=165 /DNA_ID=CAMNT_0039135101 /DNA_START=59 /DNA_END=556 /DNA_ORIENTATION=+